MNKKFSAIAFALAILAFFGCGLSDEEQGVYPCSFCDAYGVYGEPPNPMHSITATANSENRITVSWSSVSNATGYYIYRSTSAYGGYSQVDSTYLTSYQNTGLSAGTAYYYKVAAYNSYGAGTQSNYASATTQLNTPTGITATANSESSITVSWSSVSNASGYYIYRSTSATGTYTQVGSANSTSYADNSLSAGTTYYYRVAAYSSDVTGSQSNYASATTQLNTPTNITATASGTSITVSWSSVSNASGYYIYRSTSATGTYTQVGSANSTSYADNSLSAGTIYYYKVAAYNSNVTGSQSSYASATTQLSVPTNITATANGASIIVSWSSVSNASGYYIYRSTSATGTYTQVGSVSSASTSYADNNLSAGTTYYYKVAAYNSNVTGSQSNYASATTQLNVPTNITATASGTSITVSWSFVSNATGYYIYRSTSAAGTYTQVGSVSSASTSYADNSLSAGITYYYKVAAYNSNVTGTQSNYASATTQLTVPTSIMATASGTSIIVSWSSVSNATGYYIYRSTNAIGAYTQVGTTNSISYADNNLSAGITYYYKVAAYNSNVTGSQSSYASATTQQISGIF